MIKIDGRFTNLEGEDELLRRELTLLIGQIRSRLGCKGMNDATVEEFVRSAVEESKNDLDRLRQKSQIEKDRSGVKRQ